MRGITTNRREAAPDLPACKCSGVAPLPYLQRRGEN